MYVSIGKKHSIYGLQSYPWFQSSTVDLGTYALWIMGDYYTQTISLYPRVINFHLDVPQPLKIWQSKWTRDSTASSNVVCQYSLTQQAELPKFSPPCLQNPPRHSPQLPPPQTHDQSRVGWFYSTLWIDVESIHLLLHHRPGLRHDHLHGGKSSTLAPSQICSCLLSTHFSYCNHCGLLEWRSDHFTSPITFLQWLLIALRVKSRLMTRLCSSCLPAYISGLFSTHSAPPWLKGWGCSLCTDIETYPYCVVD